MRSFAISSPSPTCTGLLCPGDRASDLAAATDLVMSHQERTKALIQVYADGFIRVLAGGKDRIDLVIQRVMSVGRIFGAEKRPDAYADHRLTLRFIKVGLRTNGRHHMTVTSQQDRLRIAELEILKELISVAVDSRGLLI